MTLGWPEVALAFINVLQVVALYWIGSRQQIVKRELAAVNGNVEASMAALHREIRALHSAPSRDSL